MPTPESLLLQVYQRYICYDESDMMANKRIAENFVSGFLSYLKNETGVHNVSHLTQGSAFEGIKVGKPDEFDFLLVFDYGTSVTAREANNAPGPWDDRRDLGGHWQLIKRSPDEYCDGQYLSIRKFMRRFQTHINNYARRIRDGAYRWVGDHSADLSYPSIGNPALTLRLTKPGGFTISIDMSICIKVTTSGWFSSSNQYYIAKKHASDRSDTYWLVMNSQKELQFFLEIPAQRIKDYYRIFKYLLNRQLHNSYVIKTAFMRIYTRNSNRSLLDCEQFCFLLLNELKSAYDQEYMGAFHNPSENILRSSSTVSNHVGWLRRLCNKSFDSVVNELIGKAMTYYEVESITEGAAIYEQNNGSWCTIL